MTFSQGLQLCVSTVKTLRLIGFSLSLSVF